MTSDTKGLWLFISLRLTDRFDSLRSWQAALRLLQLLLAPVLAVLLVLALLVERSTKTTAASTTTRTRI